MGENKGFLYIIKEELLTCSKWISGNSTKQKPYILNMVVMTWIGIGIKMKTDSPPESSINIARVFFKESAIWIEVSLQCSPNEIYFKISHKKLTTENRKNAITDMLSP